MHSELERNINRHLLSCATCACHCEIRRVPTTKRMLPPHPHGHPTNGKTMDNTPPALRRYLWNIRKCNKNHRSRCAHALASLLVFARHSFSILSRSALASAVSLGSSSFSSSSAAAAAAALFGSGRSLNPRMEAEPAINDSQTASATLRFSNPLPLLSAHASVREDRNQASRSQLDGTYRQHLRPCLLRVIRLTSEKHSHV